jgi:hypothetical protein
LKIPVLHHEPSPDSPISAAPAAHGGVLVVADLAVTDVEILLESLAEGTRVLRLGVDVNPLPRMASALREHRPTHLHFICHGEPGAIRLGNAVLTGEPLASVLAVARPEGLESICLWACGTATGTEGRRFLETLANRTGARVHGAAGPVGNPDIGGSWELPICAVPRSRVAPPRGARADSPAQECSQADGLQQRTH